MNIAILGGTGPTGRRLVEHALARRHDVVALVRRPDALSERPGVRTIVGDAREESDVRRLVSGADAVISCLGVGGIGDGRPSTFVSETTASLAGVMEEVGPRRLVVMSNIGAGDSGWPVARRFVYPAFLPWLPPIIDDKTRMEVALDRSTLDWTAVRFPNITSGPERRPRRSASGRRMQFWISADTAAGVLVDEAERNGDGDRTPSVSH